MINPIAAAAFGLTVTAAVGVGALIVLTTPSIDVIKLIGSDPPPMTTTTHEGKVDRIVVTDPRNGGWSGNRPNPTDVKITLAGGDGTYDLSGDLKQAAAVTPGERVVIICVDHVQPEARDFCRFGGVVRAAAQPTS